MALINENYLKLPGSYLFAEIARRVSTFKAENPSADIIRLGIGDVTQPLAPASIKAMHDAVDEMANQATFRGYGPEQGYDFLIEKIIETNYKSLGVEMDEVFVSDGSKSDVGNIQEIRCEQYGCNYRPSLSCIFGYQCNGWQNGDFTK